MKKHISKFIAILFLLFAGGISVNAQTKIGYIEFQELLPLMPEYKKASAEIEALGKNFQAELKTMNDELEKKYAEYQKNENKMAEAVKEYKQKEIRDMQSRLQEFQETAQETLRKKETELLKPIIEKAKNAISQVAKEGGYAYVLDSSPGTPILYKLDGDNLMAAVKKKLGITATATTPQPGAEK